MKKILLMLMVLMTSCVPMMNNVEFIPLSALESESESAVRAYISLGKTTSRDILNKYNLPLTKICYEDGKYSYIYYIGISNISASKNNILKVNAKFIIFTFDKNNILCHFEYIKDFLGKENLYNDFEYEEQNTPESPDTYLTSVQIGTPKGTIFRKAGKPLFSELLGNSEYWQSCAVFTGRRDLIVGVANNKYKFLTYKPGTKIYTLTFTHDNLSEKKYFVIVQLTDEERAAASLSLQEGRKK